jgi:hypothetical protein
MQKFGLKSMVVGAILAAGCAALAAGQEDRWETKVPFKLNQPQDLEGKVGPVRITNLKVTDLGRGYSRGQSGLATTLRVGLDVNNPGEDWVLLFTLEFVDKNGKVIDRVSKKEGYEEESKITNIDHPILEYVVPMISEIRLSVTGRLD